jgi:hypothetical protein
MSSQGNGQPIVYTVHTSVQTKNVLKQLHAEAWQAGTSQRFLAALRQIGKRLQQDPSVFGEALYRLPALKLVVYQAVVPPLVVLYAVHEDRPLVFIRSFRVLS